VRIAGAADHRYTLGFALFALGFAHLRRGDLPRTIPILERALDLSRTWQFVSRTSIFAAALGAAYALVGRVDEATPLVASAVEEFRCRAESQPACAHPSVCGDLLSLSRADRRSGRLRPRGANARPAPGRSGSRGSGPVPQW